MINNKTPCEPPREYDSIPYTNNSNNTPSVDYEPIYLVEHQVISPTLNTAKEYTNDKLVISVPSYQYLTYIKVARAANSIQNS